jgi:hypothetical protein
MPQRVQNVEDAIFRYRRYFNKPAEVLATDALSREDKIRLLKNWKQDIQIEEVAEDENMHSSKPDILDEVEKALHALEAYKDIENGAPM